MSIVFSWDIDLSTMIGRKIEVETIEGIKRISIVRDVKFGEAIRIFDRDVSLPIHIEFDDGGGDIVSFNRIKSIQLYHAR